MGQWWNILTGENEAMVEYTDRGKWGKGGIILTGKTGQWWNILKGKMGQWWNILTGENGAMVE